MNEDAIILKEYREAFRRYAKDGIIDLDKRLKHKFNFQIHRLENVIKEWEGIIPPIRQSQFFVALAKTGTGEKTIGQFTFPIQKNTLFVIPKRVTNSSKYWSIDCSGYMLSFNIDFFLQNVFPRHHIINKRLFKTSLKPFLVLQDMQIEKIDLIFEYLLEEYREELKGRNEMIAIKVLELLILCDRFFVNADTAKNEHVYNSVVESFNELLDRNITKERTVRFYARALNMHPNRLNFLVKKYTGLTAKETIADRILSEAKSLLISSSLTIKEISYELGFDDPDYFSSFFRKKLHLSPAQYRQEPV